LHISKVSENNTTIFRKLAKCFLGPFYITGKPSTQSYQIKLPNYLYLVYPVFYVFQLEPASPSTIPNYTNPPLPIEVNGNLKYEISQILDSKWDHCRKLPLLYYVQLVGYKSTDKENSWISTSELVYACELVQDFHLQNPDKPRPTNISDPLYYSKGTTSFLSRKGNS